MPEEKVDQRLDLRGEVCLYPTAKTSMILKKGEKLIRLFSILATANNERRWKNEKVKRNFSNSGDTGFNNGMDHKHSGTEYKPQNIFGQRRSKPAIDIWINNCVPRLTNGA
jgi:hypothetical protein